MLQLYLTKHISNMMYLFKCVMITNLDTLEL